MKGKYVPIHLMILSICLRAHHLPGSYKDKRIFLIIVSTLTIFQIGELSSAKINGIEAVQLTSINIANRRQFREIYHTDKRMKRICTDIFIIVGYLIDFYYFVHFDKQEDIQIYFN